MPARGHAVERRVDGGKHAAQLTLAGKQLADEIAHMAGPDLVGVHARVLQRALHRGLQQLEQALPLAGGIQREVGLRASEDINGFVSHGFSLGQRCRRRAAAAARAASRRGAFTSLPLRLRGSGVVLTVMKSGVL